ncbi:MAG: biotin transporter BioY [Clostridium sp.]
MKSKAWTIEEMAVCGLFTALIAAGAFIKISIPVQPFPMNFTLQWFFVLLAAFMLGPRLSFISVCVYLAVGLVGVPVFAAGGGPAYLVRPTFGFLLGFAAAAYVTGTVDRALHATTLKKMVVAATCGLVVMYLSGMFYFYFISNYVIHMPVSWKIVFINCCLLTVFGDFVLCILAAVLAKRLRTVMHFW